MIFGQLPFFVFLAIVWIVYQLLSSELRKFWLLTAGAVFIGYLSVLSLVVLLASFMVTRLAAKAIHQTVAPLQKRKYRIIGIGAILGIWSGCKLVPLFLEAGNGTFQYNADFVFEGVVTLGVSFYSLENIGYLIDLSKKRILEPIPLKDHLFYTLFFPKLLSGPITQIQQFTENQEANSQRLWNGAKRMFLGLFKKVVLADRLAPLVAHSFDHGLSEYGVTNLVVLFLFAFQLYFDFSAYTDCAIGIARMFGFELPENFKEPFSSKSISEFWRRWHMSLFDWLRKYVFNPLSFRWRKSAITGTLIALWITFLLSGLWHGFGPTFLFYAIFHAFLMSIHYLWTRNKVTLKVNSTQLSNYVFVSTLVALSFAFFRSKNLDQAFSIFASLNNFFPENWKLDFIYYFSLGGSTERIFNILITIGLSIGYLFFEPIFNRASGQESESVWVFFLLLIMVVLFGHFGSNQPFIYGQF